MAPATQTATCPNWKLAKMPQDSVGHLNPSEFVAGNAALLASLPLFADIPFSVLELSFRKCEYKRLSPGELVLSPDVPNYYLHILLSGKLTIHLDALNSGKNFQVMPGEFVGEVSLIDNMTPTAFVTACEDSQLLCIHEMVLWSEFFQVPGVARNILRQFAGRMRARNLAIQRSLEQSLRLEHLEKELRIAQDIQASMLPQPPFLPAYPQIDLDAMMKPAKEVSGDMFDAFALDESKACFAIGDVAGKGVPAALFMVKSITLLRTEMMKTKDLSLAITAMNHTLCQDNPQCMFVTLVICVLDVHTGRLQYVNGGHNRPLFGSPERGFQYLPKPKGIIVGVSPEATYEISSLDLAPGDTLIIYTDGITEANNLALEEFSDQRLLNCVNRLGAQSAGSVIAGILDNVRDFVGEAEQSDDLTLLVLRYLGGSAKR
jgi:sigma-B regulation protein RsbU (phosphoserine phosphatase)